MYLNWTPILGFESPTSSVSPKSDSKEALRLFLGRKPGACLGGLVDPMTRPVVTFQNRIQGSWVSSFYLQTTYIQARSLRSFSCTSALATVAVTLLLAACRVTRWDLAAHPGCHLDRGPITVIWKLFADAKKESHASNLHQCVKAQSPLWSPYNSPRLG